MSSIIDMFNMQFPLEAESLEKENQNLLHTSEDDTLGDELDRVYHDSITRLLQIHSLSKENHMLKAQIVELERQFYRRQAVVDSME
jgi:hypothetical protein